MNNFTSGSNGGMAFKLAGSHSLSSVVEGESVVTSDGWTVLL
jgi:hypothetical protein